MKSTKKYDPNDNTKENIAEFDWKEKSALCLNGINQSIYIDSAFIPVTDTVTGIVTNSKTKLPSEEQIMLQSRFSLSTIVPVLLTEEKSSTIEPVPLTEEKPPLTVQANYFGHFINSSWNNYDSPESDADSFALDPDDNYKFHAFVKDNEGNISNEEVKLPLLRPPVIDTFAFELIDNATGSVVDTLTAKILLIADVIAHDPDNDTANPAALSIEWAVRKKGENKPIAFDSTAWKNSFKVNSYFYRELIESKYVPGEEYEIYVKVMDDDVGITSIKDGYGVTITKVGDFTLAEPLPGDVNLDGVVDSLDENIIQKNMGQAPEGVKYITQSTYLKNWIYGDINCDGVIDTADLAIVKKNKPKTNYLRVAKLSSLQGDQDETLYKPANTFFCITVYFMLTFWWSRRRNRLRGFIL